MKFSRANQLLWCRKRRNWTVLMVFVFTLNLVHEAECETTCPDSNSYSCRDGTCISTAEVCDGKRDCSDGDDESECELYQCGLDIEVKPRHAQGFIAGGTEARKRSWPWFVLITRNSTTPKKCLREANLKGGGAVINKHWVLTAAHVLNGEKMTDYVIFVGIWNRQSTKTADVHSIAKYVEHPNFNENAYLDNDIALIKIGSKLNEQMNPSSDIFNGLKFGRDIRAVCLSGCSTQNSVALCSTEDELTPGEGVVIGFGHTEVSLDNKYTRIPSRKLKQATLRIRNRTKCHDALGEIHNRTDKQHNLHFTENMLCFGPADKKTTDDACRGDSGGPVMKKVPGPDWVQIGIVSYGYGCGNGTPGFYTDVSKFTSWIGETIAKKEPRQPRIPLLVTPGEHIAIGPSGERSTLAGNAGQRSVCSHLVQFLIVFVSVLNFPK